VVIGDPRTAKNRELLLAMGEFVDSLKGQYITSFDSGTTVDDVRTMAQRTAFAAGGALNVSNASESTAEGVHNCIRAAAELQFGASNLSGVRVAIQGLGNVGHRLAERLSRDGAKLFVADTDEASVASVERETGAKRAAPAEILQADVDILAPCALGGVLTADVIGRIRARAVVGGANNQLASAADDTRLYDAGILYCPDYLANAGGIIDLHYQRSGGSPAELKQHLAALADTFREVVERSRSEKLPTGAIADRIAEKRFRGD
jgi:leucine dehydrogenase